MNASKAVLLAVGLAFAGVVGTAGPENHVSESRAESATTPTMVHTAASDAPASAELNEMLEQYCVRCHNERRLRGDLSLEGFDAGTPEAEAEVAERMIHKLRAGMMPPAGVRRPPEDSLTMLAASLEDRLDDVARRNPNPGRRTFQTKRRSNRSSASGSTPRPTSPRRR
jgi:hypothetical protein